MSGHLIGCAGDLDDDRLAPSHKLALVAFADSADDRTHIGFAGYVGVQKWAMCSRGRAAELIRDLVEWGYLKQHKRAHRGQRAEYVVFPGGCCDLHRVPDEEPDVDVDQLAQAAGVTVEQARKMLAALTPTEQATDGEKASGGDDPMTGNESDGDDPIAPDDPEAASEPVDNGLMGPERVHDSGVNANAFTPSKTNSPLPPPASRQGRCAAHPNGHANCRACGTTPRQRAAAEKRAAVEAAAEQRRREVAEAAARRDVERQEQTGRFHDPDRVALRQRAKAAVRTPQEVVR